MFLGADLLPLLTLAATSGENPEGSMFLGEDLLPWLTLAIGGGLAIGTIAALVKPREEAREGELERPPLARSLIQITIGLLVSIWAVASLLG
ncbi:MAG: hypothetical protein ACRBK7_00200 [Acidimicrobiales bacterium]